MSLLLCPCRMSVFPNCTWSVVCERALAGWLFNRRPPLNANNAPLLGGSLDLSNHRCAMWNHALPGRRDTANRTTTHGAQHKPKHRQAITTTWMSKRPGHIKDQPKGNLTQCPPAVRETTWATNTNKETTLITGTRKQ